MNYAEKNKGIITFHKILQFAKNPAVYKALYIDMLGEEPEKEEDKFILGRAYEDFVYGKDDKYEIVARRTKKNTENEDDKKSAKKTQLTRTQGDFVTRASKDMLANPFGAPKGSKKYFKIEYKGLVVGGEVDEFYKGEFNAKGMTFDAYISDYKTCASFKSLNDFIEQYTQQLAFYQFLVQVSEEIDAHRVCGIIKASTKDSWKPMSKVMFATPETLLQRRGYLLGILDDLVEAHKNNSFPELTWHDTLEEPRLYGLFKQKDYEWIT